MSFDGDSLFHASIGVDDVVIRVEVPVHKIHAWWTGAAGQIDDYATHENGVIKECVFCKANSLYLSVAHVDGEARRYCRRCKRTFPLEVVDG